MIMMAGGRKRQCPSPGEERGLGGEEESCRGGAQLLVGKGLLHQPQPLVAPGCLGGSAGSGPGEREGARGEKGKDGERGGGGRGEGGMWMEGKSLRDRERWRGRGE